MAMDINQRFLFLLSSNVNSGNGSACGTGGIISTEELNLMIFIVGTMAMMVTRGMRGAGWQQQEKEEKQLSRQFHNIRRRSQPRTQCGCSMGRWGLAHWLKWREKLAATANNCGDTAAGCWIEDWMTIFTASTTNNWRMRRVKRGRGGCICGWRCRPWWQRGGVYASLVQGISY
jgi:hypothetical protein